MNPDNNLHSRSIARLSLLGLMKKAHGGIVSCTRHPSQSGSSLGGQMSPLYLDGLASHSAASLDSTRVGRALVLLSSCLTPTKGEKLSVLGTVSNRHSLSQSS